MRTAPPNCPTAAERASPDTHADALRSINQYQGGASVDVFDPKGSNPTQNWKVSGPVQKVYDKAVKGYVFHCDGGPNAKMQLLKDERRSFGLVQPYLVLQVCVSMTKPFALELSLTDTARPAAGCSSRPRSARPSARRCTRACRSARCSAACGSTCASTWRT